MKLHRLSAPLRAASGLEIGQVLLFGGGGAVVGSEGGMGGGVVIGLAIVLVLFVVQLGWEILYVQRFAYTLTDDSLDIDSGVLSRRERSIPIRRIQNVDITRDPFARLAGLAAVAFETAGGGDDAEGEIRYVTTTEAERLRNEIQRLKRANDGGESDEASTSADVSRAETVEDTDEGREELFVLSTRDLLAASALSLDLRPLLPVALLVFEGTRYLPSGVASAVVGSPRLGVVLTAVGSFLASAAVTFARFYGFRLWRSGDELRYERGLVSRYTGSIPFEKIQHLVVSESLLLRRFGYAALDVETAGYGSQSAATRGSESVVPFAERGAVLALARSIEGFGFDTPAFSRPPKRARRRYAGRYAIAVVAMTTGLFVANRLFEFDPLRWWFAPLALLVVVPFAAHYTWLHRGVATDEGFVLTRNGFWRRTTEVVPYYRVQTVNEDHTIFQRRWNLATVVVDTAGTGSLGREGARAVDFDRHEADALRETVRRRLRRSVIERRMERRRRSSGS
ncbi:PH domain-containing protein [Halococcus hamelinensis]|uniref:Membrane-flanked domain protein n=1 Tax=Halococcus hamelinensis 100A6 TaxID=1132509 RepID=M0M2H9_9EURY|nr:PH domain-containing protein [Halococcus hamelinensis]EMA39997.1 membrane-flanked domain protein [Halococcus hamelinensis 100A6]